MNDELPGSEAEQEEILRRNAELLGSTMSEEERRRVMDRNLRLIGGIDDTPERLPEADPPSSGRGVVWGEYHQFYLMPPDRDEFDWDGSCANGIIESLSTGGAIVLTGVFLGSIRYSWRSYPAPPSAPGDEWEDTAEVRVRVPDGRLHVEGWGSMTREESNLALYGPGEYAVRCSARGRAAEWDEGKELADEEFLIEIWPAASHVSA